MISDYELELVERTDPVLRRMANKVTDIRSQVLPSLAEMRKVMKKNRGIGLAAPQVGISLSFFITGIDGMKIVINPIILRRYDEMTIESEGCLSLKSHREIIHRNKRIRVRFLNRKNKVREIELTDYSARVFQHEYDHLQGICIFNKPTRP